MMKLRSILATTALLTGLAVAALPQQAHANSISLCAPDASGASSGSRRVVNPSTGNAYITNSFGCLSVQYADVGYFLSQGFALNAPYFSLGAQFSNATPYPVLFLPAGAVIRDIIWQEVSAVSPTGGMQLGTTSGGTDVMASFALAANSLVSTPEVSMLKRVFPTTTSILTPTRLYPAATTTLAGSAVNVTIIYGLF
jgi:hypothetical protein